MQEPFMGQVTLTSNGTSYQLFTLLQGIAPANVTMRKVCAELQIQEDVAAGAAKLFIGNSGMAAGGGGQGPGQQLVASQQAIFGPHASNLIHLDEIYLTSDTNSVKANITVITR